jgi:ribose transport system permease protein
MKRLLGVILLVVILYGMLLSSNPGARSIGNLRNLANESGFYGVLTLGVAVLIISGGIDLSIGSVVALGAVGFCVLMTEGVPPYAAVLLVVLGGAVIGLFYGLLVTRLRLQPFLITLCGLFIFRGLARMLSKRDIGKTEVLYGTGTVPGHPDFESAWNNLVYWLIGQDAEGHSIFPAQFAILILLALVLGLLMHGTIYGRYLYAIGHNESAARYAGIRTDRYKVLAYVICSALAGLGGVLYTLDNPSVSPSNAALGYELYAITGAVLGGCSLRGGEGLIVGAFLGTAVLPVLRNLIVFLRVPSEVEFAAIGLALLLGTIADEFFRRRAGPKR